jgi:hypothetical protein
MNLRYVVSSVLFSVVWLAGCQPRQAMGGPDPLAGTASVDGDRTILTRLVRSVQLIDSVGRERSTLPTTLEGILPVSWLTDPQGRPLNYVVEQTSFSLRATGQDGLFHTHDDIYVVGRLGRSLPCELYVAGYRTNYENVAPSCDTAPATVLQLCSGEELVPEYPRRRPNPVELTGERLVLLSRRIECMGRSFGSLPRATGIPLYQWEDAWGQQLRYSAGQSTYEVRSPGADGRFDTEDDVAVRAELGHTIPCRYFVGLDEREC